MLHTVPGPYAVSFPTVDDSKHCLQPLKDLLLERGGARLSTDAMEEIDSMNFAGLRDRLLTIGPLDVAWIKKASVWLSVSWVAPSMPALLCRLWVIDVTRRLGYAPICDALSAFEVASIKPV